MPDQNGEYMAVDAPILLAGFALVLLGIVLLLFFLLAGLRHRADSGGGLTVILLGPIPIIMRHGFKVSVIVAATILVTILLIIFTLVYGRL
jgi:uncharacterized membrane protein